jgi:flagellar protein FlaG
MMTNTISSQTTSLPNTKVSETPPVIEIQAAGGQEQSSTTADQKQPSKRVVEALVNSLNELAKPHQTSIQFKLYDKLNEYYVQVIDDSTKTVIKEIPSKELLDSYTTMMEHVGLLINKKI